MVNVEEASCKRKVRGSSPRVGSTLNSENVSQRKWTVLVTISASASEVCRRSGTAAQARRVGERVIVGDRRRRSRIAWPQPLVDRLAEQHRVVRYGHCHRPLDVGVRHIPYNGHLVGDVSRVIIHGRTTLSVPTAIVSGDRRSNSRTTARPQRIVVLRRHSGRGPCRADPGGSRRVRPVCWRRWSPGGGVARLTAVTGPKAHRVMYSRAAARLGL